MEPPSARLQPHGSTSFIAPPRWPGADAARGPEAKRLGGKPRGSAAMSRRPGQAHRRDSRTAGNKCTGAKGLPRESVAKRKRTRQEAPHLATTSASHPRPSCSRHAHPGHSRAGTRTRGRPEGGGVEGKREAGKASARRGVEGAARTTGVAAATTPCLHRGQDHAVGRAEDAGYAVVVIATSARFKEMCNLKHGVSFRLCTNRLGETG